MCIETHVNGYLLHCAIVGRTSQGASSLENSAATELFEMFATFKGTLFV